MVKRVVKLSQSHSFFLFGPRATGKSTLLQTKFPDALYIDLLDPLIDERLAQDPTYLKNMIAASSEKEWIVIDEVQKNPKLLDVVHSLSKNKKIKFALTGSSARKLKRGEANLLAGRAFKYFCHPLTHLELKDNFHLDQILQYGSLPEIFDLQPSDKSEYLRAYVDTYFKEEIVAEQIVRKLRPFQNFLKVASQMNGKILNLNKIANDVGVDHSTVQNYFEVLEDTLVGFHLEPFHESIRKRQRQSSKFYYFDLGVTRALKRIAAQPLSRDSYEYGDAFEHFLILEIKRLADYFQPDWQFSYLTTKDNAEIDLIIERPAMKRIAIEIKSTSNLKSLDPTALTTLEKLSADIPRCETFLFSQDPIEQKIGHIWCLPWQKGIKEIGLDGSV
jgi:predicted AAA+ superfamily ATPase